MLATWLRGWLPADVPLVVMEEDMFIPVEVFPDTTIPDLVRRMLEANQGPDDWREDEPDHDHSPLPVRILPEAVVERLVRQMLEQAGDTARGDAEGRQPTRAYNAAGWQPSARPRW